MKEALGNLQKATVRLKRPEGKSWWERDVVLEVAVSHPDVLALIEALTEEREIEVSIEVLHPKLPMDKALERLHGQPS